MDILTIGHCTVDLFMKIAGTDITAEGSKMCFLHGSKVEVEDFRRSLGGNALNVAVGAKTLGMDSGIYTELGEDEYSDKIVEELKEVGIDTNFCNKNKNSKTNVSTVIVYAEERTIFSYHEKLNYKIQEFGEPKIIYYTSLPKGYETFQEQLLKFLNNQPNTMLAFNPGTMHFKEGIETFKNILTKTDILFVNKEEAQKIAELENEQDLETLHKKLNALGPKLSVITDAENGASVFDGDKLIIQKIYKSDKPILDKTGAGDAFSAGFIAAIHYGKNLTEALKWGVANSGNAITEVGALTGLLTKEGMIDIIKKI